MSLARIKESTICFLIHVMMKTKRDIPQLCILYLQKETRFFVYHIFVFNAKMLLCLSSLLFFIFKILARVEGTFIVHLFLRIMMLVMVNA